MTQDVLARHARECGLRWNAGKVAQFERGLHNPALTTVLAASQALTYATGATVGPADLVTGEGNVAVGGQSIPRGILAKIMRGDLSWALLLTTQEDSRTWDDADRVEQITRQSGVHEIRLAQRLDCSVAVIAALSAELWGRSFSDERDAEAGPNANAQKRGRVSRRLQTELERALADGNRE